MRFDVSHELALFAESVRAAIGDWAAGARARVRQRGRTTATTSSPRRLAEAGWGELWADDELLGAAVAGGIELGRAVAPICLVDEATLGAPLWVDGQSAPRAARPSRSQLAARGGGLALGPPDVRGAARGHSRRLGNGARRAERVGQLAGRGRRVLARLDGGDARATSQVSRERALELAVEHARTREQFGAPLAALPAVQARLADAALATDGLDARRVASAGERGRRSTSRSSLRRKRVPRGHRDRAAGPRRESASRSRPACTATTGAPGRCTPGRGRLRHRSLSQSSARHSGDRTCSIAQSSHSRRDSA